MGFDFKGFVRFTCKSLFNSRGTNYRLTSRRIAWLALFYAVFPVVELVTWIGLLLDELLFPGYRQQGIRQPVFIVGNPRSGTTFLQRLLARDEKNFNSMRTWEMLLAPSITMRKVISGLSALDRRLGSPLHRCLGLLEETWQEENTVHRIAVRAPEEDEYLLTHIWSNLKIWLYAAMLDEAERYTHFDAKMPPTEKERIMTFYTRCVQRHLYAHGGSDVHYLAKNPHFTPMIDALYDCFPDVRIIYLARSPLDMIPSYISLKEREWRILGDPVDEVGSRDYILDMAEHWYSYPLERLEHAAQDSYIVVNFNDLVNQAGQTVAEIYERFGLEIGPAFAEVLRKAAERARHHQSEHKYSLEAVGLSREQIVDRYEDVFDRFGFDTRADTQSSQMEADNRQEDGAEGSGDRPATPRPRRRAGSPWEKLGRCDT